jgi:hypothetical protein
MATIAERYNTATDYVRRAVRHVETGAFRTPMSLWFPGLAAELAGGQVKTEPVKNELTRLEARWHRATSDIDRARIARDAELLADRVQENLPGAPQDRKRTNLYEGEHQSSTAETSYGDAFTEQAGDAWDWVKETASELSGAAQGIGQWLLVGGGILLGIKTMDYLREREQKRNEHAASAVRRRINAQLVDIAEARNAKPSEPHFHVLVGLCGLFMPHENRVFATRIEAEEAAREIAVEYRDQGDEVTGSAKSGYFTVGENECIEISECTESDCLRDLEE